MAAGTGIGFKLLVGGLIAWGMGGSKKKIPPDQPLTKPQDVGVALSAAGLSLVKDSVGISASAGAGQRYASLALPLAGAVIAAIVGGPLALLALAIAEAVPFITLLMNDQKMLDKGRQRAKDNLISTACTVRDNVFPALQQMGLADDQAHALAIFFGWQVAASYNNAAYLYIQKGGVMPWETAEAHMGFWADRGMYVPQEVIADMLKAPYVLTIPVGALKTTAVMGADPRLFNQPNATYPGQAQTNAGAAWSDDLAVLAVTLGTYLWCSMGLISGWDSAWQSQGPGWPGNPAWMGFSGDPSEQAFKFYQQQAILSPLDTWSSTDRAVHSPTGLIWLAEATDQKKKPQISYEGLK